MSRTLIHPGEILKDELDKPRIATAELAQYINSPENRIRKIIYGKRNITANTSLRLGK